MPPGHHQLFFRGLTCRSRRGGLSPPKWTCDGGSAERTTSKGVDLSGWLEGWEIEIPQNVVVLPVHAQGDLVRSSHLALGAVWSS